MTGEPRAWKRPPPPCLPPQQNAARLRPNDAEIFYYQGRLEYVENRFAEAIAASQRAIALAPGYATAHTNLALSYEGAGDLANAAEHHRRAIELARAETPIDEWPFLNYAAMLTRGPQPEAALPVLEDAVGRCKELAETGD